MKISIRLSSSDAYDSIAERVDVRIKVESMIIQNRSSKLTEWNLMSIDQSCHERSSVKWRKVEKKRNK